MLVCELEEALSGRQEQFVVRLGDVEVADDGSAVRAGDLEFPLDATAEMVLAKYLKIPPAYLAECPGDFKATTLRFWIGQHTLADTVLESSAGHLIGVHSPHVPLLPRREVGAAITKVFDPDDEVRTLKVDNQRLHIDVTTKRHRAEVANPHGVAGRPTVGDITDAGARFLAYPNMVKAPSVGAYLERLVCTNGMSCTEEWGHINLKGRTVPEVLDEMEAAAERVLSGLDERLARYVASAEVAVPGSPASFCAQIARERKLPRRVLDRVLDHIHQIPDDLITVYDVEQAFSAVANSDMMSYRMRMRLQELSGDLAFHAEHAVSRCHSCERLF